MTKKHLLTILFIVLSAIILVSCSNTQAVVSEKSTTTLPLAESTSVTESTTVNTTVQKTDNASAESSISKATKTTNTETAKASTNKPTSPNTKADKAVKNTTKTVTTTSKITTSKKKQPTTQKASRCSNNNNHSMKCGNMGRWFDSKSDVKAYVDSVMKSWADKWESGEISDDEYFSNCPQGYEC